MGPDRYYEVLSNHFGDVLRSIYNRKSTCEEVRVYRELDGGAEMVNKNERSETNMDRSWFDPFKK